MVFDDALILNVLPWQSEVSETNLRLLKLSEVTEIVLVKMHDVNELEIVNPYKPEEDIVYSDKLL